MDIYDNYTITEESFKEWKNNSVIEDKDKILEEAEDFFDWLDTADYE